jgi:FkbM family methyltransferase
MINGKVIYNIGYGFYKRIKGIPELFHNPYKQAGLNWLDVRLLKNLPENKVQSVKLFNKEFHFSSKKEFINNFHEIFIEEIYKQDIRRHTPYIIDCGANIGISVLYVKLLFPTARIVAFEPDDLNFNLLQKNIKSFNLENVELRKEAVWISNTNLSFAQKGSLSSKIETKATSTTTHVKAVRLKDLMTEEINFLKLDIEGAEYSVLKDIADNLSYVQNLFIEYHGTFEQNRELSEMLQIVVEAGFKYCIKQATDKHPTPFLREENGDYDLQLNIFCFRK